MRITHLFHAAVCLSFALALGCSSSEPAGESASESAGGIDTVSTVSFANAKCPIMGGEPSEELVAEYQGQTIGFCCEGCPEKWAALSPEEQAEKFAKVAVATSSGDHDHSDHDHDHGDHDHGDHDHGDHNHAEGGDASHAAAETE